MESLKHKTYSCRLSPLCIIAVQNWNILFSDYLTELMQELEGHIINHTKPKLEDRVVPTLSSQGPQGYQKWPNPIEAVSRSENQAKLSLTSNNIVFILISSVE